MFPLKERMSRLSAYLNFDMWMYITIVAVLTGLSGTSVTYFSGLIGKCKHYVNIIDTRGWLIKAADSQEGLIGDILKFVAFSGGMITLTLISTGICQVFNKNAVGFGVPHVKTVLSGVKIVKFMDMQIFLVKYMSLLFSIASGIGTGKAGPLIHMNAMIAYNVGKLPYFKKFSSVFLSF